MVSRSARRPKKTIDTLAYLDMVSRVLTGASARVADGDLNEFGRLLELRRELDEAILGSVRGLRAAGVTWDEIGGVSGHTRQAAIKMWNPRL